VSHHTIFISACAQNVRLQHERKRVDADATSNSTVNNRVTQSGPLADDASFQFVDVRNQSINLQSLFESGKSPYKPTHAHPYTKDNHNVQ